MKKPHYYYDMTPETYDFIIRKGILKESKKEIMIKTGYSSRTICYRKKDIYAKISKYLF